jgi:hypothetical protein
VVPRGSAGDARPLGRHRGSAMTFVHGLFYACALVASAAVAFTTVLGGAFMLRIKPDQTTPDVDDVIRVMGVVQIVVGSFFGLCFLGLLTARRWARIPTATGLLLAGLFLLWGTSDLPAESAGSMPSDPSQVVVISMALTIVGACFLATTLARRHAAKRAVTASA